MQDLSTPSRVYGNMLCCPFIFIGWPVCDENDRMFFDKFSIEAANATVDTVHFFAGRRVPTLEMQALVPIQDENEDE